MVMMLRQCCCGCTLKTGSIIIGVLQFINSGYTVLHTAVGMANFKSGEYAPLSDDTARGTMITVIVFTAILAIVSICLIIGALNGDPKLLLPWLVYMLIVVILLFIASIVILVANIRNGSGLDGHVVFVLVFLNYLLYKYFLLVVYSLFRELKGTAPSTGIVCTAPSTGIVYAAPSTGLVYAAPSTDIVYARLTPELEHDNHEAC